MRNFVIGAVMFLGLSGNVQAQEPVMAVVSGGMICDTETQLKQLLANIGKASRTSPLVPVEGCGTYRGQPVMVLITPAGVYEDKFVKVQVAKFSFPKPIGEQYGWVHTEIKKPDTEA